MDWREPSVWVEEAQQQPPAASSAVSSPAPLVSSPNLLAQAQAATEDLPRPVQPSTPKANNPQIKIGVPTATTKDANHKWPLAPQQLPEPASCAARVSGPILMDVLSAIMLAARESRPLSPRVFVGAPGPIRELRTFLRAVDALNASGQPGTVASELQCIFENDDTDALSRILSKASAYHDLISQLRSRRAASVETINVPARSATALASLARLLGQAVVDGGELIYGGAYVSRAEFIDWFLHMVESGAKGPLGGTLIADISRSALYELSLSPVRLQKAIHAAMENSPLADLDFVAGGTPESVLEEEVAVLNTQGWTRRRVSADGLLGFRSVRRR
jgi:hypothetical protein